MKNANIANGQILLLFKALPFWTIPVVTGGVMLMFCYLTGAFAPPNGEASLRIFNGALAMPIFVVYVWIAVLVMKRRAIACLNQFTQNSAHDLTYVNFEQDIESRLKKNIIWSIALSILFTCTYLYHEDLIATDLSPALFLLNIYTLLFWFFNSLVLLQLFFITQYVIKHFLDNEKIDLFGIQKLLPISDLVITNTIISTFGLALIPLFWIGRTVPTIDKIIVTAVFILMSGYLFWPVLKVQKIISRKKRLAIMRINTKFQTLFESKLGVSRRLTDDAQRLRKLSSLISAKQEISVASEWPIDLPQSIKGVLISMSIPLSWVAGSFVESFISKFF
tara:strand:+ start:1252 stop:2256 length:1005 start_codon:yes stop_codon:yes gene_type:complete